MSTKTTTRDKADDSPALATPLSRRELRPMINKARRYGRAFKRNGQLLAVELRPLQDAGAHLYGRKSFGAWAAIEFADLDLSAENAKKLSQAGRALLVLQRNGKIDLDDSRTFPGTTGARGLASVLAKHGEQALLDVFERCPPDHIIGETVAAATREVLPPQRSATAPQPVLDEQDDEDEEPEEIPKPVQDLRDHIERLHDYLHDIECADDADPIAVTRAYEHFLHDAEALRPVLDAVLPGEDAKR